MKALAEYFTTGTRTGTGERYVFLADDAPEWLADAVREAHEDEFPNDWRYEMCRRICREIDDQCELGDGFVSDGFVSDWAANVADCFTDVYTGDLVRWVADVPVSRLAICDDAAVELGASADMVGRITVGQFVTIERMAIVLALAYLGSLS